MTGTPATDSTWERLPAAQLAAVAAVDGERLELERSRLPAAAAERLVEPTYSVRSRFRYWERLVTLMENDWAPRGRYIVDEYINDLESRDRIDDILRAHPVLATGLVTDLLARLDRRFLERTLPDDGAALRTYAKALRENVPLSERWYRRPVTIPWL
ncbi:hypothetical protein [Actinomadura sp. 21ATH]|uniref:hypothetical protein n=1 Tax=Actinomadura sp. 21ATH TaxID=1735444 RepID=UPI0035BF16C2